MMTPDQWRALQMIINLGGVLVAAIFVSNMAHDLWPIVAKALGR